MLHALLGIPAERELLAHPKVGSSWEGFAIEEAIRVVRPDGPYFWATHTGAELDLLLQDAPRFTPSMRIALGDLGLEHLTVLYPGDRRYDLEPRVTVAPLGELATRGAETVLTRRRTAGRRSTRP